MRIVLAPDKFKGSLSAHEVATALERGIRRVLPGAQIRTIAVADGGDGLLEAMAQAGFGRTPLQVTGPNGSRVATSYAVRGDEAVIEMAAVCGLGQQLKFQPHLTPLTASSRAVGEAIAAALEGGARNLVVGIGGSASTDGGAGMLSALGAQITTVSGDPICEGGAGLLDAEGLDLTGLHPALPEATLTFACDVDNPLTGRHGAAAIYAPQKGADPAQVRLLDSALTRWADLVDATTGSSLRESPGAGAAGGVGYAARTCLGAALKPGAPLVLARSGFHEAVLDADLVITGEGALDEQTLSGKAPAVISQAAHAAGARVVAVCGVSRLHDPSRIGVEQTFALADRVTHAEESFTKAGVLLEQVGAEIGAEIAAGITDTPEQPQPEG